VLNVQEAAKVKKPSGGSAEFPEEDGVLVLGASNFDSALAQFDPLLVEFYVREVCLLVPTELYVLRPCRHRGAGTARTWRPSTRKQQLT
jgi:hypothetical protein